MLANYPQDCANCLSQTDLSNALMNNATLYNAYQYFMSNGVWPSGNPGGVGYTVSDPTYGSITLVLDGTGNIYALVPSGGTSAQNTAVATVSTTTNAPPYVSPSTGGGTPSCPGWSNIASLNDVLGCLSTALSSGENLLITGVSLYVLYKLVK